MHALARTALAALTLAGALAAPPASAQAQAPDVRVIVNAANPTAHLTRDEVSRLFLRRMKRWPQGGAVLPVDLPEGAPLRRAFSRGVLGKDVETVAAYWAQQIFTGEGIPPATRPDEAGIIAYVAGDANAVGYVAAGTALPATVKAVAVGAR